jgi:hypothetical protein
MKTINILGKTYTLHYKNNLARDHNAKGESCGNAQFINIDPTLCPDGQEETFIHEIIEQLNCNLDLGLNHQNISSIAIGLYQVFSANPDIFGKINLGLDEPK